MSSLERKIEQMRRVFRGEIEYGKGKPAEQAKRFRNEEMFEEIIELARANSDIGTGDESVDVLISLSGFSPATTILAYEILRPKRLLVITSRGAKASIDVIGDHIVAPGGDGGLKMSQFEQRDCEPTDPLSIYRIIKRQLEKMDHEQDTGLVNAYLDITGGKKVMSATAALAAWQLDLPLVYIDSDFDPELRQPEPGTERAVLLDNPTTLFGDQEMTTATSIFDNGAFEAAAAQFDRLAGRLANPTQARFMRDLSRMYQAWCDMNFEVLDEYAGRVEQHLKNAHLKLDNQRTQRLDMQAEFLRKLSPNSRKRMLLSYFLLGLHYDEQGRHDFATLLYYRTIEGCFDVHLNRTYEGFDTGQPDYTVFDADEEHLIEDYDRLAAEVFGDRRRSGLPGKIGFMNAALLLRVVGDELLQRVQMHEVRGLRKLKTIGEIRNRSVLAHGFERITEERSRELRMISRKIFDAFWDIHGEASSLEEKIEPLRFVKMEESIC